MLVRRPEPIAVLVVTIGNARLCHVVHRARGRRGIRIGGGPFRGDTHGNLGIGAENQDRTADADSFAELRRCVLELARHGVQMQRFKGLGEMNAEQLRETTMDPQTRTLQRVTIDDAALAERIFTDLMGDKVEPRKAFIENHAKEVRFLDV